MVKRALFTFFITENILLGRVFGGHRNKLEEKISGLYSLVLKVSYNYSRSVISAAIPFSSREIFFCSYEKSL